MNRILIFIIIIAFILGAVYVAFIKFKKGSELGENTNPGDFAPNTFSLPPKTAAGALPGKTIDIRQKIIASQIANSNGDVLLFKTANYKIEYITSPNFFLVTITKDPAETYKQEAQYWFLKFGLKQADLCNLPVRFILGNLAIRKTNKNFSGLPSGCS